MKALTALTFAITALGLITSISIVSDYSTNCLKLIWIPYGVLFALLFFVTVGNRSKVSKVSLFISACLIALMCTAAYSGVSYGTSHSSTEGLIFVVVPIYAVGIIPIVYGLIRLPLVTIKFIKGFVNAPYEY